MRHTIGALLAGVLLTGVAVPAFAQQPAAAAPAANYLKVGAMAPDIEMVGATRYGVLQTPVKLSNFRGKTVVLAWFFRARTRG